MPISMTRTLSYLAEPEDIGTRIDLLCTQQKLYPSRSVAVRHIEEGKVLVNGEKVAKKHLIAPGDVVIYEAYEEEERLPMVGEDIPLSIKYEDENLAVISKPAGLVVHPSPGHEGATLVNALIFHFGRENLAHIQGDDRPGIVHRLDGDTSGLMIIAKDDTTGCALQEEIRLHTVDRRYLTLVHGRIAPDTGMIDAPIARGEHDRLRMKVSDSPNARSSVTTFNVLERFEAGLHDEGYTLAECKLHTGRTHQIRVHMKYIHHSCVGDPAYGSGAQAAQLNLTRQFLHSYHLGFTHPASNEPMEFNDALPVDLQAAYNQIKDRSLGLTSRGEELVSSFQ